MPRSGRSRRVSAAAGAALALAAACPPLHAQAADSAAVAALREFDAACRAEAGLTWGTTLCGPVVLVHPATRAAVASAPDPGGTFEERGGAFAGRLPDGVPLANTAVEWGAGRWTMVLLPLPADRFDRLRLVAHEAFHRVQTELGMGGSDPASPHLDERDGRTWLRLELRALAAALRGSGPAARRHALDALLFRAHRNRLYPGSDSLEARLERQEGLAEYTGARLAMLATGEPAARMAAPVEAVEGRASLVRSFAYGTGPALGLLLDRYAPGWRERVRAGASPAGELAAALRFRPGADPEARALRRAASYGHPAVAAEEDARAARRAALIAAYSGSLVDGPVLVLRQRSLRTGFDPNTLVPLGDAGTVYPTGTFGAEWGTLEVSAGGALVSPDFARLAVPAPAALSDSAGVVRGPGWTLTLAPGWTVHPAGRAGDREVAHTGS